MKQTAGFTLIELLLYITLTTVVFIVTISFVLTMIEVRAKVDVVGEVQYNAQLVQERLIDAVRHAEAVDEGASVFLSDLGVLHLEMVDALVDPTIFSLTADDGMFQVSEAGAAVESITTERVAISNFVFTDLTSSEDSGIIQVQFTITAANEESNPLFDYEESFQTTLRIPLDD
jgi:hypothetical protein